jgi:large subunit ribosomal protein L30
MSQIFVKQIRGSGGQHPRIRAILQALGLKGIGQTKVHKDNNCTRGMVNKVKHMIEYKLEG